MEMLPTVVKADYLSDYLVAITFADGTSATVNFEDWLDGPVFEPLKEPEYFRRLFIEAGTLAWPNGADIAPETLYQRARAGATA